jgi:hypothetical protein
MAVASVAAPLGTEFTYQGVFTDAGTPASGVFDFRFILYDAEVGGSQVGSIVTVDDLAVSDGRVSAQLDFGPVFDGTALWLEVAVRDGASAGAYAVLSPRQELTAAPFAQHAKSADTANSALNATTAGDADTLDGQHGAYYLAWSNLVGVPPGLDDGDDDTLGSLSCTIGRIARWSGTQWRCSPDDDNPFIRTYVVGRVGTPTQNGSALRNALAAITPPTSQGEAVLVVVDPGLYDLGSTGIEIYGWTTIQGAGRELTKIVGSFCDPVGGTGLVYSSSEATGLRKIWVENTCSSATDYSTALSTTGVRADVENVRLEATGTALTNYGFWANSDYMTANEVEVRAENGALLNVGIETFSREAVFEGVRAESTGGTEAFAMRNGGIGAIVRSSRLEAADGTTSTGGLVNWTADELLAEDVYARGESGSGDAWGVYIVESSAKLDDVRARGPVAIELDGGGQEVSMYDVVARGTTFGVESNGMFVEIGHSWIRGNVNSVNLTGATLSLNGAVLGGGPVLGSVACTGCMRGGTFLATGCP